MIEESERLRTHRLDHDERRRVLERLRQILSGRPEVLLAVAYGSFVRCEEFRDVDVAIYVSPDVDPLRCSLDLSVELTEAIGFSVDVRPLNDAPTWFTIEVFRTGVVLVERIAFLLERLHAKALDELYVLSELSTSE